MKTKLILLFVGFSLVCNSQFIEKLEIEPFFNPVFLQLGDVKKNSVKAINEKYASTSFKKSISQELGIQLNYLISDRFFVGTGISWWKQNYDFSININPTDETPLNVYGYNRTRMIHINYQSLRLLVGYRFQFNSELKLHYQLNTFGPATHNVAESIPSKSVVIGGPNGLKFEDKEYIFAFGSTSFHSLGLNYSVSLYQNLRAQLGINWMIRRKGVHLYSYENTARDNQGIENTTLLDLKVGSGQEYFFYTGIAYRFKLKKK